MGIKVRGSVLLIFISAIILSSCASYKVMGIRVEPIESYRNKTTLENITVAVEPFDTLNKAKSAFYVDLTSKNIRPIQLIVENKSDADILIIRSEVEITDRSGNIYRPVNSDYVFSKFEKNELLYAFFGFGIFSYMSAEDANRKMKDDWYKKEMPEERVVASDRKTSGFVFFEISQHLSGCIAKVNVKNLKSGRKSTIEVPLS